MKWPYNIVDAIFICFISDLFFNVLKNWDTYNSCYAPIHIFFAMTFATLLFTILFLTPFLRIPDLPRWTFKYGAIFLHWIFNPFLIYLVFQGIIWQIQNMNKTNDCIPPQARPTLLWFWLTCLALLTSLVSFFTFTRLRNWIRMRPFRRRLAHIRELTERRDFEALNQLLYGEGEKENKIGLSDEDFDQLATGEYSQSLNQMLSPSYLEECSICLEDYKIEDGLVFLPKCKHAFHSQCIKEWLTKNYHCPICKANVLVNLQKDLWSRKEFWVYDETKKHWQRFVCICIESEKAFIEHSEAQSSHWVYFVNFFLYNSFAYICLLYFLYSQSLFKSNMNHMISTFDSVKKLLFEFSLNWLVELF